MITKTEIENRWFDIISTVLISPITVIIAEETIGENRPTPPKPYVRLQIIAGPTTSGSDEELRPDPAGKFTLSSLRQYTVSLQAFGQGGHDSLALLQTCLYEQGFKEDGTANLAEVLKSKEFAIVDRGSVSDIPELKGVGFEKRAALDIIFNVANNKATDLNVIEKVTVTGTIEKPDGSDIDVGPIIIEKP